MSTKNRRMNEIVNVVRNQGQISIRDLAAMFDVADLTIRRDIQVLEKQGLVQNFRGIILSSDLAGIQKNYDLRTAGTENFAEKEAIGVCAAGMIRDGDVVIIDNGTTTARLAANFPRDVHATVLCYNLNILNLLYDHVNLSLIFCGGYFHRDTEMFICKEGLELIRHIRANKVFVSATGVHDTLGITCSSSYELDCRMEILKASQEKILLVDSSKFGKIFTNYVCDLDVLDKVVTDTKVSQEWIRKITDAGAECITV